jgi:hypothetical protein
MLFLFPSKPQEYFKAYSRFKINVQESVWELPKMLSTSTVANCF